MKILCAEYRTLCDNVVHPVVPGDVGRVDVGNTRHLDQRVVVRQELRVPVQRHVLRLAGHTALHLLVVPAAGRELQLVEEGVLFPLLGCGLELLDRDGGGGQGAAHSLLLGKQVLFQHLLILFLNSEPFLSNIARRKYDYT